MNKKVAQFIEGKTFTLNSSKVVISPFKCICGGNGKNAYLVTDDKGNEFKVGSTCLSHLGITISKKVKAVEPKPEIEVFDVSPMFKSETKEAYLLLNVGTPPPLEPMEEDIDFSREIDLIYA